MHFLPLLMAMYGAYTPEEEEGVTGRSLRTHLKSEINLESNLVDNRYMYSEVTKDDLGDIALSVKQHDDRHPLYIAYSVQHALSFPGLPGSFDVSGNLSHFVPQGPEKVKPRFLLYSNKAKTLDRLLFETDLDKDGFEKLGKLLQPKQKLYLIVHGFLSSAKTAWMQEMKDEILDQEDSASVVLVDWSKGCSNLLGYSTAAANTRTVARSLAFLVKILTDADMIGPEHVHYIGHSLGAQTGGFFGQDVKTLTGRLVSRITGLDPAGPLFESNGVHLREHDADFVDVLHTSVGSGWTDVVQGRLGMASSCGHVDFYPNGGQQQPGCWRFSSCSHSKATEFYADSVRTCEFPTRLCDSYEAFLAGHCAPSCEGGLKCGRMGHPARMPLTGNQFTETTKQQCAPRPPGRSIIMLETVTPRRLDRDAELLKTLPRSVQILLADATPEERRKLVEALREERRRGAQRRPN
ncbi:hypothetical protein V5799_019741 [Amblyomma americanum]|uniref:Lipase domain-containing protein n=1 Tax=Amblyomma americanum TaxID=6943 RepID=A0AAQ4EVW3_AMBAM